MKRIVLLAMTVSSAVSGQTSPLREPTPRITMTACIDERPWIPYTNPDPLHPGLMQTLVSEAAESLHSDVIVVPLPWLRCLESVRTGKIDALIGGSDVPFVREVARFPIRGNDPEADAERSLGTARIMLVKRVGSVVEWNGAAFGNKQKPTVAVAMGTQIMIDTVRKFGGVPDSGGKTDEQNLKKLLQNRVDLMAAYEFDLEKLVMKLTEGRVETLKLPLIETHYYIAFSRAYYEKNTNLVERFWNQIALLRKRS